MHAANPEMRPAALGLQTSFSLTLLPPHAPTGRRTLTKPFRVSHPPPEDENQLLSASTHFSKTIMRSPPGHIHHDALSSAAFTPDASSLWLTSPSQFHVQCDGDAAFPHTLVCCYHLSQMLTSRRSGVLCTHPSEEGHPRQTLTCSAPRCEVSSVTCTHTIIRALRSFQPSLLHHDSPPPASPSSSPQPWVVLFSQQQAGRNVPASAQW